MRTFLKMASPLLLAVILIMSLELALRFFNYGYDNSYVIQKSTPAGPKAVLNPGALLSFLSLGVINSSQEPFLNIAVEKPVNNIRVLVLGGSAAYGAYILPDFSFARYLEAMLELRLPGYTIDVVNLAFPGLNSSAMTKVLTDALSLKPDFVVCYEAGNELGRGVVMQEGPIPPQAVFFLEQMSYALNGLKIYQLAVNYAGRYIRGLLSYFVADVYDNFKSWHSMTPPALNSFTAAFRYNMKKIVSLCQKNGIPVFLCTYAYNMKNLCTADPFSGNTGLKEIEARLPLLRQAYAFEKAGDYWAAIFYYERFQDFFPDLADPLCHIAFCYQALGMPEQAALKYERARSLADGSLEKIEALNQVVRDMASSSSEDGAVLVDILEALKKASPLGFMPGEEHFSDSVHFTLEGSYEVAANLYRSIMMHISEDVVASPPSRTECERRLGGLLLLQEKEILDGNRKLPFGAMSVLMGGSLKSYTLMHEVTRDRGGASSPDGIIPADHREPVKVTPDNRPPDRPDYYFFRKQVADLSKEGKQAAALAVAEQLAEATDRHSLALILYGQTLLRNNQPDSALEIFKEAMGQPARAFDLNLRLSCAEVLLYSGRPREAADMLATGWPIINNREPFIISFDRKLFAFFKQRYLSAWQRAQQHSSAVTNN